MMEMINALEVYFIVRDWAIAHGWRTTPDLRFYKRGENGQVEILTIPEMYRLMTGEEKSNES